MSYTSFGTLVRKAREHNQLSTRRLALMIGVSQTYIVEIESGKRKARKDVKDKLVNMFTLVYTDTDYTQIPHSLIEWLTSQPKLIEMLTKMYHESVSEHVQDM